MKKIAKKLMNLFATKKPKAPAIRIPVHCPSCNAIAWLHDIAQPFDTECECGAAFTVFVNGTQATTKLLEEPEDYMHENRTVEWGAVYIFKNVFNGKSWPLELQGNPVKSADIQSVTISKNGRSLKVEICLKQLHNGKNAPYYIYLHYQSRHQCEAERDRIVSSFQCINCVNKKCPATVAPTIRCRFHTTC